MKSKAFIPTILAGFLGISLISYGLMFQSNQPPLPVLGQIEPFTLTDLTGSDFELTDLIGKVWVSNFIFTTCSDICPVMTKNSAAVHRSFKLLDDFRMVSVSVNPEYDTPEILESYARKFDADISKWHFLTGSRKDITDLVVGSFKLGKIDEPVFHSSYSVLVDRRGQIRGYYDGTNKEAIQKLVKDIARLLKEES